MMMAHNETPYVLTLAPFGSALSITPIIAVVRIMLRLFPICNGFLHTKDVTL
jgi:hypothetical protein